MIENNDNFFAIGEIADIPDAAELWGNAADLCDDAADAAEQMTDETALSCVDETDEPADEQDNTSEESVDEQDDTSEEPVDEQDAAAEEPADGAATSMPAYSFAGLIYTDVPSLVIALARNWEDGKKQVYRGLLAEFFDSFNPLLSALCRDAEAQAEYTSADEDLIFRALLYGLYPELDGFYWKGQSYDSLAGLGLDMLENLWKNNGRLFAYWDSILENRLLSDHFCRMNENDEALTAAVEAIENAHADELLDDRDRLMHYYTVAYLLSGQKLFAVGDRRLKKVKELTAYLKELLDSSYEEFEDFCHAMIDYDDTLDAQLEAWLIALGKQDELDAWRVQLQQ